MKKKAAKRKQKKAAKIKQKKAAKMKKKKAAKIKKNSSETGNPYSFVVVLYLSLFRIFFEFLFFDILSTLHTTFTSAIFNNNNIFHSIYLFINSIIIFSNLLPPTPSF